MKKLPLLVFLIIGHVLFAQHSTSGECKLKPRNTNWLTDFKDAEQKDKKLILIVDKIIDDSNYLSSATYTGDLDNEPAIDSSTTCTDACTMRFVLIYGNAKGVVLDLVKYPHLVEVITEFTSENISNIELNEKHDRNIYGVTAKKRSGIILHTDDKKLKKKVRRTLRDFEKK